MSILIPPSRLSGTVPAPSSKSHAQRLLILASLSNSPSRLLCNNLCDDILTAAACLNCLGADIEITEKGFNIHPIEKKTRKKVFLDCRDSGATLRFILPLVCALDCTAEIKMGDSLRRRPHGELISALISAGAKITFDGDCITVSRGITKNELSVSGNISSQFISGALLALAAVGGGAVNITSEIRSRPYIDLTLAALKASGVETHYGGSVISISGKPHLNGDLPCEGDFSSAAFWLTAAAMGRDCITVTGLNLNSVQGDRRIPDILTDFGTELKFSENSVTVLPSSLHGTIIDASDIPDLVPPIAVLAAAAEGETIITNASSLRLKESDRLVSVTELINSIGGSAQIKDDAILVRSGKLHGGNARSYNDHRIIMSAAIASNACTGDIYIDSFFDFKKSYLHFDRDFKSLGGYYEHL